MKRLLLIFSLCLPLITHAKEKGFALSGGVSLGSYEAGVLYSLLSQNREQLAKEVKVVYGASAGSINGLLGIFDLCGYRQSSRESNLLWKMWVPIGLNQLEAQDKSVPSLFDRKAILPLFQELKDRWKEGFKESCDIHFGVAVTRRGPLVDELRPGLEIVRQSEFFSVRIRGQGPGKYPIVENSLHKDEKTYRGFLPVGETPQQDIQILLDMIQASSAFPGAFAPYPIESCFYKPGEKFKGCKSGATQKELFIDGGIYHNGPVGYVYETLLQNENNNKFDLYYINASSPLAGSTAPKEKVPKDDEGVFNQFFKLFSDFMTQARVYELAKSLERYPDLENQLKTNPKNFPLVSEPLYAFLGFLETDFRKSDFYLGIYDGEKISGEPLTEDAEYLCYKDHLVTKGNCKLDHNLKVLTDLAKHLKKKNMAVPDFDTVFDYLEKHEFIFRDLGLKKKEARYGRIYVKTRLNKLLKSFAARQPEKEHAKLNYFIRPSLNYLHYTPPDSYWYAVYASSPEVGYSGLIPERYFINSSFRYNLSLMVNDFSTLVSRADDLWALTPMLGLEYEPVWLNSAIWQWRGGIRAGYVLAPEDDFGAQSCDEELADQSLAACSGGTAQIFLALSVLERLRLQFVYIPLVVNSIELDEKPEMMLQVGIQFGE